MRPSFASGCSLRWYHERSWHAGPQKRRRVWMRLLVT
jgi:hypothetical protein